MLNDLPSLQNLIRILQQVPYLASKNIYRVAHYFLSLDSVKFEQFCTLLTEAKKNIAQCQSCFSWREKSRECSLCNSSKRDKKTICVVESWHELMAIEKTSGYNGVYHVLGGVICPLEGIGPEDLTITSLIERVSKSEIKEVILATNQTPEGEATATFIASKLKPFSITVSCLARGIPVGMPLENIDKLTVYKALSERRLF
jgi:recombination protein RecR